MFDSLTKATTAATASIPKVPGAAPAADAAPEAAEEKKTDVAENNANEGAAEDKAVCCNKVKCLSG